MWVYKLVAKLLTHTVLYGLANIMIFGGMLLCVVGGLLFVVTPWVTWIGMAVFIGGLCVLGWSDQYLPSEEKKRSENGNG
jgi:hypothetical protein